MYEQSAVLLNELRLSEQAQAVVKQLGYAPTLSAERELADALISREHYADLACRASETAFSDGESQGYENGMRELRERMQDKLPELISEAIKAHALDVLPLEASIALHKQLTRAIAAVFNAE
jgi:flagellar biosynthesis/type III secretory pathway protein FliH